MKLFSVKYSVYILYSATLDTYYVGCLGDVPRRLQKHLYNHKGFTGRAKDWELKYTEEFDLRADALKRELQIKKWKSRAMLEQLIKSDLY
ncbi:hypothetical protein FGF1_26690 [Flavobacteriaceae bacterium GF1]